MKNKNPKKMSKKDKLPTVSICTPTFNRRPFIPCMIKCFEHQTYPKEKIEWIIIDDGTDKIEDLLKDIKEIKYFKYDEKLTLGKKRNLAHEKSTGDIIIYMDDDDYYPPERISHAVETLQKNPKALCAGSSVMHIYFKHIGEMYRFGPYGEKHATAATFAFRKELLLQTKYEETACLAEERHFLKDYSIPFAQLDTMKTILVLSHVHNSFDKKELLAHGENPVTKKTNLKVSDFIKDKEIYNFHMKDIDALLEKYEPGKPENKKDVVKQTAEIRERREKQMLEQQKEQMAIHQKQQLYEMNTTVLEELKIENESLKNKTIYLENKLKQYLQEVISIKKENAQLLKELQTQAVVPETIE